MNKVIATDLDGTLFYPKKKITMIPKRNIIFLRRFIDLGGRVVIVSGRNMPFAKQVIEKLERPVDVIGCNGAFINIEKEMVVEHFIPNDRAQEILNELSNHFGCSHYMVLSKKESLVIAGKKLNWIRSLGYKMIYGAQGIYAEKYVTSNTIFKEELKSGKLYKMMLYFGLGKKAHDRACEANKYIRANYSDIESSWSGQFIEITASNVNKAEGLKSYCEAMKISEDQLYVIGDSGNDISMLSMFKNSFCMNHASDKIKKYAKETVDMVADLEKFVLDEKEKN